MGSDAPSRGAAEQENQVKNPQEQGRHPLRRSHCGLAAADCRVRAGRPEGTLGPTAGCFSSYLCGARDHRGKTVRRELECRFQTKRGALSCRVSSHITCGPITGRLGVQPPRWFVLNGAILLWAGRCGGIIFCCSVVPCSLFSREREPRRSESGVQMTSRPLSLHTHGLAVHCERGGSNYTPQSQHSRRALTFQFPYPHVPTH